MASKPFQHEDLGPVRFKGKRLAYSKHIKVLTATA
jgi:hypothetical protein